MFGRDNKGSVSMEEHKELVVAHNQSVGDIEALQLTIKSVLQRIDTLYQKDDSLRRGVLALIDKVIEQEQYIKELKSRQAKDDTFYLALAELGENIKKLSDFVGYPPTPFTHVPQKFLPDNDRSRHEADGGSVRTNGRTDRQTKSSLIFAAASWRKCSPSRGRGRVWENKGSGNHEAIKR